MYKDRFEKFLSGVISGFCEADASGDLKKELDKVLDLLSMVRFHAMPVERFDVPGLRHLETALKNARHGPAAEQARGLGDIYQEMHWSEYYPRDEISRDLVDELAVGQVTGPRGPVLNNEIILGAVLLGPDTYYPHHVHPASEVYYILSGYPRFRAGQGGWASKQPGDLFLHPGGIAHATRTGQEPMLALYTWTGDVSSPARFLS